MVTFSIFQWRCPDIKGEGLFADVVMIALGLLFIAMSDSDVYSLNFLDSRSPSHSARP